jgi:predicted Ser/Thr protein kinase
LGPGENGKDDPMAASAPSLPLRYDMEALIARGGMGDVWRATDEKLGRMVAIKVLSERYAREDEFRARFLREAQTAARLSGEPYVVTIHDVGENDDGLPFIVMEYAPGGTVADRLRERRVERQLALRWLEQTAAALDAAHARGVVHRDVKPANLLIADDGSIRVSDFGIARAAGLDTLTLTGTVLGSSGYMAPEQMRGERTTPATDRYAFACVAYELLGGRRPFERESVAAEAAAHAHEPPPSAAARGLPSALDPIFARGLAKRPEDRPATCAVFVADLREVLERPSAATTAVAPTVVSQPVVRHRTAPRRVVVAVAAAGLLAVGAATAWALAGGGGEPKSRTVVVTETRQGETVERTVTESDTVTVEQPGSEGDGGGDDRGEGGSGSQGSDQSGAGLNDEGFRLLQQGDVNGALPLLESAVSKLRGSSTLAEAYASYNLAFARFSLGDCDGVAELLDRSQEVQGKRKEIDRLRKQVEKRC